MPIADAYQIANRFGIGVTPIAGEHPVDIIPPDSGQGLPAMVGNDRLQLIALVVDGSDGSLPVMRHWYGAAMEYGEIIGARRRSQLVPRYATNENAVLPVGVVELPYLPIAKGNEATVAGVLVEADLRPPSAGGFDGGIGSSVLLGFDAYVEGWRQPDVRATSSAADRQLAVVRSEVKEFSIAAGDVGGDFYPTRFGVYLECRITDQVRSVRVGIGNVRGCEIVSAEVVGSLFPSRLG